MDLVREKEIITGAMDQGIVTNTGGLIMNTLLKEVTVITTHSYQVIVTMLSSVLLVLETTITVLVGITGVKGIVMDQGIVTMQ